MSPVLHNEFRGICVLSRVISACLLNRLCKNLYRLAIAPCIGWPLPYIYHLLLITSNVVFAEFYVSSSIFRTGPGLLYSDIWGYTPIISLQLLLRSFTCTSAFLLPIGLRHAPASRQETAHCLHRSSAPLLLYQSSPGKWSMFPSICVFNQIDFALPLEFIFPMRFEEGTSVRPI